MAKRGQISKELERVTGGYLNDLVGNTVTLEDASTISGAITHSGALTASAALIFGIQAVTAAGSDQAGAGAISATGGTVVNVTGADNTKGVRLPLISDVSLGQAYLICNNLVNKTLEIYPGADDGVNPASDNAAITVAADTIFLCIALTSAEWFGAELTVVGA
tara:strand:+ start:429 stop:917 length:489 start_codon:yes stop_codon:yes gene_type:complete